MMVHINNVIGITWKPCGKIYLGLTFHTLGRDKEHIYLKKFKKKHILVPTENMRVTL